MTKPRIAYMMEPPDADRTCAIIVAVHTAREYLSFAERAADSGSVYYPEVLDRLQSADGLLDTAITLCCEVDRAKTKRACELLARARQATKAAYHQGNIARSYAEKTDPSSFESKQANKTRVILRRAAEAARQEVHRALAELAERFPDAYDIENEGDGGI